MTDENNSLLKWTVEASAVGFKFGVWPDTFEYADRTWTKERVVDAESGAVQFVEYATDQPDEQGRTWLVVYAD